jgi:uroporphyrin-III C-methyltransferase
LANFPATVLREQVKSPALIIVGHVVSLKEQLQVEAWLSEAQQLSA